MKIENIRRRSSLAVIYVNGQPGPSKMVTPGVAEELRGPAFMLDGSGNRVYMAVPGEFIIADVGAPKAANIIMVGEGVSRKSWIDQDGARFELWVCDYAYKGN